VRRRWDLALAATLAFLTTGLALVVPIEGPLRVVPAIAFVLFLPGYLATSALFPRTGDLSGPERLALSLGLSLAIVPLVGLALNFTPWGIRLEPIVVSLDALGAVLILATEFQRRRLGDVAFVPDWPDGRAPSKANMATVALVALAGVGGFAVVRMTLGPSQTQTFTEFAMVGPSGTLKDLPTTLARGGRLQIGLMVTNHENSPVGYEIRPMLDGQPLPPIEVGTLADGAEWSQPYTATAPTAIGPHELAFDLDRTDAPGAYRHLSLKFEVTASGSPAPQPVSSPSPSSP
jgi:uncharacterized membrane protein